ncbi:NAD(P)-binding protein [Rickenella mellea]|uniref:NAD(P)-binding protein n=1 Tax=Rickenella mellea TaxID=50990 RepID=A0A4Y7QAB8_9AGAM|nr:NAD(P)-binding protein [Rickenella mellea]
MSSVFFLGATGYVGGAFLVALKSAYPDSRITALVRSEEKGAAVKAAGAQQIIVGSHEEHEKIRAASAEADVVVNAADSDYLPLTSAIIAGLKERAKKGGKKPLLFHTSGTGVIYVGTEGKFVAAAEKVWNDSKEEDVKAIDASQPHRNVDLELFKTDKEGIISCYIMCPPTIYGTGKGPVNRISIQVPGMIRAALRRKQAVYVGEGTNKWNNVHIDDLMDLYLIVFKLATSGEDPETSPYAKFYFASAAEHTWGDVARDIAPLLYKRGLVKNQEAISVPASEDRELTMLTATNSRSVSERSFALGWKPKSRSLKETLEEDVDAVIKHGATAGHSH